MKKLASLSNGEFRIMNCIWSNEIELTQARVMKTVNQTLDKKLHVSTFATYLRRIMKKGYLKKVYHGDGHPTYRPLVSRDEYFERKAQEFNGRWGNDLSLKLAIVCLKRQTDTRRREFIEAIEKQHGDAA